METSIEERVRKILADELGFGPESVTSGTRLNEDLGADSLDVVEIVMILEEEFEIEIPDAEAEKVVTVADVVKLVTEKVGDQ